MGSAKKMANVINISPSSWYTL